MSDPKLSIIICVYNEEPNIKPLNKWINESIKDIDYEIIYVDDGSTDRTRQEIIALNDPRVVLVEFRKNYGQSSALYAGIDQARGEYLVTMDGDLQNDPSDIHMMLKLAEDEDWDLVAGVKKNRQDGVFFRKIPSKIANSIIRNSTGVHIKDYGCTLKVFKSDLAKNIGLYGELHRFIPVLASLEGARITQVDVKHHAREFGKSKYGINRTFKVVSDLLLMLFFKKYMSKPMHLFGGLGLVFFIIGTIINTYFLIQKILGHDIWGKPMLLLGILLLIAGIQLITVGIMSDVLMRTYYESQNKRPYKSGKFTHSKDSMPGYLKALLKIALSIAALWYVYTKIDLNEVLLIFGSVSYGWLATAALLFIVSKIFSSFRLNLFFAGIHSQLTEISNLRLYLLGMYYNLFLPGGIGGDGYKIYLLNKQFKIKAKKLFWAVLLDRVNGVLALFVLAMVLVPFIPVPQLYKYLAISLIPVSVVVYYLGIRFFFKDFRTGIHKTNLLSLAVQVSQLISAWFILFANHNADNTLSYLFLFLVSSIVATLPITIGGIGSREITFLFGAEVMNLDIHQSIALSLLFYVITALVSLAGIYFSLNGKALDLHLAENQLHTEETQ